MRRSSILLLLVIAASTLGALADPCGPDCLQTEVCPCACLVCCCRLAPDVADTTAIAPGLRDEHGVGDLILAVPTDPDGREIFHVPRASSV